MARVILTFQFADGDSVQAVVDGKTTYPDALAQMRAEAVEGFRQVMIAAMAMQSPELLEDED